jgi:hypothetical protein
MRLLTLVSLASVASAGAAGTLDYATVAAALQVRVSAR